MNRREFVSSAGALGLPQLALAEKTRGVHARALMKAGTQHDSSDEALRVLAALGVHHICSTLPSPRRDEHWSVEALTRLRERVESFGIKLEMAPLPMSSSYITVAENPNIILGKDPERGREIDGIRPHLRADRIMHKHAGDRVEPHAAPVVAPKQCPEDV